MNFLDTPKRICDRLNRESSENSEDDILLPGDVLVTSKDGKVSSHLVTVDGFVPALDFMVDALLYNNLGLIDDLYFLRPGDRVKLTSGIELSIQVLQVIDKCGWERELYGRTENWELHHFHIVEAEYLVDREDAEFLQYHEKYPSHFYVVSGYGAPLDVVSYKTLGNAITGYKTLPVKQRRFLGFANELNAIDLVASIYGKDVLLEDYKQLPCWRNPEIFEAVRELKDSF